MGAKEVKKRIAFETKADLDNWVGDNCRVCQRRSNCELKEHIGIEMEIKHAFKIGYEDIGFGYIALDNICRYYFPIRNGDYVRIGGLKNN